MHQLFWTLLKANRAASSVTTSYKTLVSSAKSLTEAAGKGNIRSTYMISITAAILFATAGLFGLVVFQMNKKIDQIDLMIVNLGTRSAEQEWSCGLNSIYTNYINSNWI